MRRTALITGGSRGLGRALAAELAERGWRLVIDGRNPAALRVAASSLPPDTVAVAGDIADPRHRERLADAVSHVGTLDLLVNNASELGPSPLVPLLRLEPASLRRLLEVNTEGPAALIQAVWRELTRAGGRVINLSSDAATEAYAGWGGYGASKAALDHLSAVLAAENPEIKIYAFDPGDMRTDMHQAAFPGEDISDRPEASSVVPALLALIEGQRPSGRYSREELAAEVTR